MSDAVFPGLRPTDVPPAGRYGLPGAQGVLATLRDDLAVATLAARKGAGAALAAAVAAAFGAQLVDGPKVSPGTGVDFVGTGPGRWLAVAADRPGLAAELAAALDAHAAITEQSDANVAIDLSGPRVREALAKGVAIDLDPLAFAAGDAAVTSAALIGVTFWQLDAAPAYRFLVGRSVASGFVRFVVASAAEFGLRLDDALSGNLTGRG
ncbi:sarcosine oxidase subunit gamma [Ancylobacter terrae]|uniref:sarcosine oxidase subunit gamma n=1 Tax=Ancylobacter sp. sgz301288 TaxID=3342077 RepID=UPI00385BF73A